MRRTGIQLAAALNERHRGRAMSQQRVGGPLQQLPIVLFERRQHAPHVRDGIHAVGAERRMRRAPARRDRDPGEAPVRQAQIHPRRLRDDGGVGMDLSLPQVVQHGFHTCAVAFLVRDGGDVHIARRPGARERLRGEQDGREAAFHVQGTPAEEFVVPDRGPVRIDEAFHADGVEVRVEQERTPAARARDHAEDTGAVFLFGGDDRDVRPEALELIRHESGDPGFARRARHEGRIDGIDRHQPAEQ